MEEPLAQTGGRQATQRGFGLAVSIGEDISRRAALAAEKASYASFWLNNPPGSDALRVLDQVARAAHTVRLGVGIIPLSDRTPEAIAHGAAGLPLDRLYLGIGSGSGPNGVERVAAGIRDLRARLECRLVVAALGPAMCRLAGAEADGVLLNWLTPSFAQRSVAWIRDGAEQAGRQTPRIMAYVRTALGDEAVARLRTEAANYSAIPAYASHFTRMGSSAMETAVTGHTRDDIQEGLAAWNGGVDEVVVRAIPANDTTDDVLAILEAASPGT